MIRFGARLIVQSGQKGLLLPSRSTFNGQIKEKCDKEILLVAQSIFLSGRRKKKKRALNENFGDKKTRSR